MTNGRRLDLRAAAALLLLGYVAGGCGHQSFPVSEVTENGTGMPLLDLVERASSGTVSPLSVGEYFDGAEVAGDGWSAPQFVDAAGLAYAWATGRSATVRLDVGNRAVGWLHLRCMAAPSDSGTTQTMSVTVGGAEVGVVDLAAAGFDVHSFRLPADAAARGVMQVSLAFAYTAPAVAYLSAPSGALAARPDVAAACDYLAVTAGREPPEAPQALRLFEYGALGDRLLQPAGSEVAFRFTVPLEARLEFGVREDAGAANGASALRAAAAIRRTGRPDEVFFDEAVSPVGTARWQADLSSIAGADVELVLRVAGGDARRRAEWIRPRLHGDPGDTDVTTNVVLIVADTLRADYLGSYGGEARTPNLDALAASGVRFRRAYSHAPMTVPSHSSMFTSLLPTEHAVLNNGYVLGDLHLTLPELLHGSGYRHTAAFISLGVLRSRFGVAQGFTEYHESFGDDWWKTAEEVNAELVPWLEQAPPEPFFLWAHYSDPHAPYAAPGRGFPTIRIHPGQAEPVTAILRGQTTRFRADVPADGLELSFSSSERPPPSVRITNLRASDPRVTAACASRCRESLVGRSTRDFRLDVPGSIRLSNAADTAVPVQVVLQASDRRRRRRSVVATVRRSSTSISKSASCWPRFARRARPRTR